MNTVNNKKSIYSFGNKVIKKPVVNNLSMADKLEILKYQLIEYKKHYEQELLKSKLKDQYSNISGEWVDETLRYYECNFADDLDSVIAYFEHKLGTPETSKQKVKTVKTNFICS